MRRFGARYALLAALVSSLPVMPAQVPSGAAPNACGPVDAPYKVTIRITASQARRDSLPEFREIVKRTLCNEDSWIESGKLRLKFTSTGDLRVGLWTASETEERCMQLIGLSVNRTYSCADSSQREVVVNARAWDNGQPSWPGSLLKYRRMLVDHEVGHAFAQRHRYCTTDGAKAPVMMQQSKGLTQDGNTCIANAWPLGNEIRSLSPPSFYRV